MLFLLAALASAEPVQQGADPLIFLEAESTILLSHDSWIMRGPIYDSFLVKAKNLEACEAQLTLSVSQCVPGLAKVEDVLLRADSQMAEDELLIQQLQKDLHHLEMKNENLKHQRNAAALMAGSLVLGSLAILSFASVLP